MAVEVVEKRKGATVCAGCGEVRTDESISKSEACACGEEEVKKSLVIVRKAVGDTDEEVEDALDNEVEDDEDDEDDDDLEDLDDEDDEDDEDYEDDDEDDDEEEDVDEDDDAPPAGVKKSDSKVLGVEALNLATALAEDIVKVFTEGGGRSDYEDVMVEFNDLVDAAADNWFKGKNVSKSDIDAHKTLVMERVEGIMGKSRIKKSAGKYDGLPEDVVKSLKAADKIVEERETEKWEKEVEENYSQFPGNKKELAKTLRSLSEANPTAFEELKKSLVAANYNLEQGNIFKRFGSNDPGETDEIKKRRSRAEEIAKAKNITIEQAEVELMNENPEAVYSPTNA